MKILVQVHGEERSYSERELIRALERLADLDGNTKSTAIVQKASPPKVGEWFTIKPNEIKWENVERACKEAGADDLWAGISWARGQMLTNPKYQGEIQTLVPEKTWEWKTEKELRKMASELGDEIVDEVIVYLELSQRIDNGEAVKTLTKKPDHLPYYRQIITRDGGTGFVGGASANNNKNSPADVNRNKYNPNNKNNNTVPAVARSNIKVRLYILRNIYSTVLDIKGNLFLLKG